MLILLSPAKSLDFTTSFECKKSSKIRFDKETNYLISALQQISQKEISKLMELSDKLAQLNFERFQSFSNNEQRQAILAFDGDVYEGIEKRSYSERNFQFAQKHLRIISGLYGILRPLDMIKPYRLEMGTDFRKSKILHLIKANNLYEFWGDKITDFLNEEEDEILLNLASEEYFCAINSKKITKKIINVVFKEKKGETLKIVGISAKKARGLMANFIIKNEIEDLEEIKKFNLEKYSFRKDLSDELNFVFVR